MGFLFFFDFFLLLSGTSGVASNIITGTYCPGIVVEPTTAQHGVAGAILLAVVIYRTTPDDGGIAEKGTVFDSRTGFSRDGLVEDTGAVVCLVVFEVAVFYQQVANAAAALVVHTAAVHFGVVFVKIAVQYFSTAAVPVAGIVV